MLFKDERDFWNELQTVPIGNSEYVGAIHGVTKQRRSILSAAALKHPLIVDYGSAYVRAVAKVFLFFGLKHSGIGIRRCE